MVSWEARCGVDDEVCRLRFLAATGGKEQAFRTQSATQAKGGVGV